MCIMQNAKSLVLLKAEIPPALNLQGHKHSQNSFSSLIFVFIKSRNGQTGTPVI